MQRWIRMFMLLTVATAMSACVLVPGRHGRLRVGVALPMPVIHVRIPGPVSAPHPHPANPALPYESDAPMPYPPGPYGSPPGVPPPQPTHPDYPSAGQAPRPALFGTVRSLEAVDGGRLQGQVLRVRVELDSRGTRVFDVPLNTRWRVGDRVRVDGHVPHLD